jgi:hypothetical protein
MYAFRLAPQVMNRSALMSWYLTRRHSYGEGGIAMRHFMPHKRWLDQSGALQSGGLGQSQERSVTIQACPDPRPQDVAHPRE